ncbi:MAG: Ppx/GppA family phosphatase [Solirubrobacterales bacterium]|nr:Ppx/GppA family phosphatase [Solirubrobacterales bacterium]
MSWPSTRARGSSAHKTAVIDLGSNSWRLVVFSYGDHPAGIWWKRTDELYEAVRIGEGMGERQLLSEAAMDRGVETLAIFGRFCRAHGLNVGGDADTADDDVHVFATSAIRDAANRRRFLTRIKRETGYRVELLSAEQEAHYGYVAAVNSSTLRDGVVLDIGGGSMQLIDVAERRQSEAVSFPVGAVRMTERFFAPVEPNKPARKKDIQHLRQHLEKTLRDVDWLRERGGRLVAMGGSVRNLAATAALSAGKEQAGKIDLGVQGFLITAEALDDLVATLAALPPARRREVPGIKPGRGDIILAAAITLQTVLRVGRFDGIEVTEAGLREGIFQARTLLDPGEPIFANVRDTAVRNLAIQYESDMSHTAHVARLALSMHASLTDAGLFTSTESERELLWAAAMLHDVGATISYDDHHKHSRYLILSAELPGFNPRERALIAQMARYHRKGAPKLGDWEGLAAPGDEALLQRCAMILRLAEHLERAGDQSVSEAWLTANGDGLALRADGDLTLARWSVERYGDDESFAKVFGRPLVIS